MPEDTLFDMQKCVVLHFGVRLEGPTSAKCTRFASQKVWIFALLRALAATGILTNPYEFVAHFAIL